MKIKIIKHIHVPFSTPHNLAIGSVHVVSSKSIPGDGKLRGYWVVGEQLLVLDEECVVLEEDDEEDGGTA